MVLTTAFCWSKFGIEAGESERSILARKDAERVANGGAFLWGIGSSIRPSLIDLLATTDRPEVLFTPMLSRPSPRDTEPAAVGAWRSATGLDGRPYRLPEHTLVTSGSATSTPSRDHFALVCRSDAPIPDDTRVEWLDDTTLRNLRTGSRVGSSQVTAVVASVVAQPPSRPRYRVAFRARLQAPYLVTLGDWVPLPKAVIRAS